MSYIKVIELGDVTICNNKRGCVQVQYIHKIINECNGKVESEKIVRTTIEPGDDKKSKLCGVDHITKDGWTKEIRAEAVKYNKEQTEKLIK